MTIPPNNNNNKSGSNQQQRQSLYEDDEELARALQEEYAKEFRQKRSNTNNASGGSSNSRQQQQPSESLQRQRYASAAARTNRGPTASSSSNSLTQAEYARRNPRGPAPPPPPAPPATSAAAAAGSSSSNARRNGNTVASLSVPAGQANSRMLRQQQQQQQQQQSRTTSRTNNSAGGGLSSFGSSLDRRPPPTAPSSSHQQQQTRTNPYLEETEVTLSDAEYARRLQHALGAEEPEVRFEPAQPPSGTTTSAGGGLSDEEFARRLQVEIQREEQARRKKSNQPPAGTPLTSGSITSSDDDYSAALGLPPSSDERVAMRVEQELRDEELARRMSTQDQDRLSAQRAMQYSSRTTAAAASQPRQRGCTLRKCLGILVPLVLLGGAAAGVAWYFTQGKDQLPDFWPSPEDFRAEDPFDAKVPSDVERWRTKGEGLELELVSALDDRWIPFFETAVMNWNDGEPDTLDLSWSYADPDPGCVPINYKLKVCNGDYGATRWRGINKILLIDQYIFASAAKMNEYYFVGTDDSQKRYTMCHEIGHGFGLPHSDESFTNADLYNCMDYTNNPKNNMLPGLYNFEFLEQMYGTVPGYIAPEVAATEDGGGDRDRRRTRVRTRARAPEEEEANSIPDWVLARWLELDDELENHAHGAERRAAAAGDGWRVLEESEYGESHEIDIGQGYSIQVHKLLA